MTQQIIEDHFFNVGSSRYQDESFRKQYPHFSAISRFGIGVLTIFMVSDEIEVMTKPADENEVRNISIRSLNGKYLIRILKPNDESVPNHIRKHGTRVRLKLRPGIPSPNIQSVTEFWILFPGCKVSVQVDDGHAVDVGYSSPKKLLEKGLLRAGCQLSEKGETSSVYKVVEERADGLVMAIALRWQPYYHNWVIATIAALNVNRSDEPMRIPSAVCVQGVRVENTSPGFSTQEILAVSNISGDSSPATNVARSSLETGGLTDGMFTKIYGIYAGQVKREIEAMASSNKQSLSEAASEGRFLLHPLHGALATAQCKDADNLFRKQIKSIPLLTIDSGEMRSLESIDGLQQRSGFWTVESIAYNSAEEFLRRIPSKLSLSQLASLIGSSVQVPDGDVLGGYATNRLVRSLIFETFEVDRIEFQEVGRQAHLHWRPSSLNRLWRGVLPSQDQTRQRVDQFIQSTGRYGLVHGIRYKAMMLQTSTEVCIVGGSGEYGLSGAAQTYIFIGNPIHTLLGERLDALNRGEINEAEFSFVIVMVNLLLAEGFAESPSIRSRVANQLRQQLSQHSNSEVRIPGELQLLLDGDPISLFDPLKGDRLSLYNQFGVDYFD
jgi:molecular chaperone HtpG